MKMKKILLDIRTLAALLMASATLAACSSDDNITGEQPVQPTEHVYTMTVNAQKGGDAADSRSATTRALSLGGVDNKTLNATWAEGERVTVYNETRGAGLDGYLEAQSDGASTTLKGELTGTIETGDQLTLKFLSPAYNTQDGTLTGSATSIDKVCDYAEATVTVASVADGNITTTTGANFTNRQAIVKFTLKDKADGTTALSVSKLFVAAGGTTCTVTPSSATSELFVALPGISNQTVTLSAAVGSATYTYERADVTFADGQYYAITVKMTDSTPLTVEALTAGTVKVNIYSTLPTGMKYAVNGGEKTLITTTTSIPVSAGDRVQFYGNGTSTQRYYDSQNDIEVKIQGSGDGFKCKAYGNIMSLLNETDYATMTDLPNENNIFRELFKDNTTLTDASGLLLPATTLAQRCYQGMFNGCSALTTAPALPATTLAQNCYSSMFHGCIALTTAPDLLAPTLVTGCYYYMFEDCSSLNSVRCLATSGISANSTMQWLKGVAATGTLYLASGTVSKWPDNQNGIPSGWGLYYPDGSHSLAKVTGDDIRKWVGADGFIYHSRDAATNAGTTVVAMVAYVGSGTDNATYRHGLAIALTDESGEMTWSEAKATCEGKTAIRGGQWQLPSKNQWETIIAANGDKSLNSSGHLNTYISNAGGEQLSGWYWTSTESEYTQGYYGCFKFDDGWLTYTVSDPTTTSKARAVLVF